MDIAVMTIYDTQDTEHICEQFDAEVKLARDAFAKHSLTPARIGNSIADIFAKCSDDYTILEPLFPGADNMRDVCILIGFPLKNPIIVHVEMNCVISIASLYLAHATALKVIASLVRARTQTDYGFLLHNRAPALTWAQCCDLDDLIYTGDYDIKIGDDYRIMFALECALAPRVCRANTDTCASCLQSQTHNKMNSQ